MNTVGELKDIYEICRFVGLSGSVMDRFLKAAEMSGYIMVRKDTTPPAEAAALLPGLREARKIFPEASGVYASMIDQRIAELERIGGPSKP